MGLFDAMSAGWCNLSEVACHEICALFDQFTCDYISLFRQYALLGHAPIDNIDKLRGCFYITKEDLSVFTNPILQLPPIGEVPTNRKTTLDTIPGVCYRPDKFLIPYREEKAANPPTKFYCKICNNSTIGYEGELVFEHFSHKSRCRKLASILFVAMCNKVC